jgi:porphobilinogen synthase
MSSEENYRPRRLRSHPLLREMLTSKRLAPSDFVAPLFVRAGNGVKSPIKSMPDVFQLSPDTAIEELKRLE